MFTVQHYSDPDLQNLVSTTTQETCAYVGDGFDAFSKRYTGPISVAQNGSYNFHCVADDSIRVFIDGQLIFDKFQDIVVVHDFHFDMVAGQEYELVVEFANRERFQSSMSVVWQRVGEWENPELVCNHAQGRDISTALEAHLAQPQQSPCYLVLIEPRAMRDGVRVAPEGYTTLDEDVLYDPGPRPGQSEGGAPQGGAPQGGAPQGGAILFRHENGTAPKEIPASIGLSNDSTDVVVLFSIGGVSRARIMTGYYRDADVTIYLINYEDLSQKHVVLTAGRLGKPDTTDSSVTWMVDTWSQIVGRNMGRTTSTICPWPFMRSHCRNNVDGFDEIDPDALDDGPKITDPGRTLGGNLQNVYSKTHFKVSGITGAPLEGAPNGWANYGRLRITGGEFAGAEFEIKRWFASGELHLNVAMPFLPDEGVAVEVEEGCAHTWDACQAKNNTDNFGGQPYLPPEERLGKVKAKEKKAEDEKD
jgi:uncharacterized phage protein (TIGR02218 family)